MPLSVTITNVALSITTFSMMTLGDFAEGHSYVLFAEFCIFYCYAERHHDECHYDECCGATSQVYHFKFVLGPINQ